MQVHFLRLQRTRSCDSWFMMTDAEATDRSSTIPRLASNVAKLYAHTSE
jgi:hypothetical protein